MRFTLTFLAVVTIATLFMPAVGAASDAPIPKPRLGLFADVADIERARERAESEPWAKDVRARVMRIADEWVGRSDEWVRDIMPPEGSRFAYGQAGCPSCGKPWKSFGRDTCDLDRPLVLVCPHCKTEFELKKTDGEFADTGDGVMVNGRRFFLRGTWNGFVLQNMWAVFDADLGAIVNLADAYALTGDPKYARKAAVLMDAIATLAPTTNGPRDFTPDLDQDMGRLQHLTSIVFRGQVHMARALDLLGDLPELREESKTSPGKTVWDNVRHGIFEEYLFVPIDTRNGKLHTLHNHEADSVRSLLLVGLLYGNGDYIRWGANGVLALLDNTIDRDGLYYETSLSYTDFTKGVFVDMAEMLVRYDPSKYPPGSVPSKDELPLNGNYFNHAALARLVLDSPARMSIVGRSPTYGNSKYDTGRWLAPGRAFNAYEHRQAQRFAMYSTDPDIQRRAEARDEVFDPHQAKNPSGGWWALYRAPDFRKPSPATQPIPTVDVSDFTGQAGVVMLKSGQGVHRRGVVARVGPNMPHAHDDQLALTLFSHGRALSADLGYGTFGNHVHLGWANRAIAHHTVVVNQDATGGDRLFRMGPGGTIERFGQLPGVSWFEASMAQVFEPSDDVNDYRRLVLQIDVSPDQAYWVDLFDVDGGETHDYSIHSRTLGEKGQFGVTGVSPAPIDGVWTLAGLDPRWRDGSFDAPGRSWGQRLVTGGMIKKLPGVEDEVPANKGNWYATPGNGYGFIYDVKAADATDNWSAEWRWHEQGDRFGLRMTMLPPAGGQKVVTALGPNLLGTEELNFVVARRGEPGKTKDLKSRFLALLEPFGERPVLGEPVAVRSGDAIVGLRVQTPAGEDVILDARQKPADADAVRLDAGIGFVRADDDDGVASLVLSGGSQLTADGFTLAVSDPQLTTTITDVDPEGRSFTVEQTLPPSAVGSTFTVSNPAYSHGSAYRVGSIQSGSKIVPLDAGLTVGRAAVDKATDDGFVSTAPLVFGYAYDTDYRFLHGKRVTVGDQSGHITAMTDFKTLKVKGLDAPKPGEPFVVYDAQAGDRVTMPSAASLTRDVDGVWGVRSNLPAIVTFPFDVERKTTSGWTAEPGRAVQLSADDLAAGPAEFRKAGGGN